MWTSCVIEYAYVVCLFLKRKIYFNVLNFKSSNTLALSRMSLVNLPSNIVVIMWMALEEIFLSRIMLPLTETSVTKFK